MSEGRAASTVRRASLAAGRAGAQRAAARGGGGGGGAHGLRALPLAKRATDDETAVSRTGLYPLQVAAHRTCPVHPLGRDHRHPPRTLSCWACCYQGLVVADTDADSLDSSHAHAACMAPPAVIIRRARLSDAERLLEVVNGTGVRFSMSGAEPSRACLSWLASWLLLRASAYRAEAPPWHATVLGWQLDARQRTSVRSADDARLPRITAAAPARGGHRRRAPGQPRARGKAA